METTAMSVLERGRVKLAARNTEAQRIREDKERQERAQRRAFRSKLVESLRAIFPDGLDEYVEIPEDHEPGFTRLSLQYPGCVMILTELFVGGDGSLRLDTNPFVIPGVKTIYPSIDPDEYGYFPGDVNVIYYPGRHERCDDGRSPVETDDLELALAMAEERNAYIEKQQALIAEKAAALEPERLAMEAALKAQATEPVYMPVDAVNPSESLINVAELVRLVRDVVGEALEERNL